MAQEVPISHTLSGYLKILAGKLLSFRLPRESMKLDTLIFRTALEGHKPLFPTFRLPCRAVTVQPLSVEP
jgi:hypothetical protein